MTVKPRAGVDVAYAEALGTEISVPGTLEIDPANLARGFVELGLVQEMDGGTATVTPRLFCENDRDEDADACGYGGAFAYQSAADATGSSWDVAFDFEAIDERKTASFSIARSQEIFDGLGVSKSSFGATQAGALQAEPTIAFNW